MNCSPSSSPYCSMASISFHHLLLLLLLLYLHLFLLFLFPLPSTLLQRSCHPLYNCDAHLIFDRSLREEKKRKKLWITPQLGFRTRGVKVRMAANQSLLLTLHPLTSGWNWGKGGAARPIPTFHSPFLDSSPSNKPQQPPIAYFYRNDHATSDSHPNWSK